MPVELTNDTGSPSLLIAYDAANHWVRNTWYGYHTFQSMAAGVDTCLLSIKEQDCPYLLNDQRRILGLWDHSVKWGITDWAPRAVAAGLTHIAHIAHPDSMAILSATALSEGFVPYLQMRIFEDIEQAKAWLHQAQRAALQ